VLVGISSYTIAMKLISYELAIISISIMKLHRPYHMIDGDASVDDGGDDRWYDDVILVL